MELIRTLRAGGLALALFALAGPALALALDSGLDCADGEDEMVAQDDGIGTPTQPADPPAS